ncbi:MAG: tetratricopeptide repeat protein, partial [Planctomycetota bacterium]
IKTYLGIIKQDTSHLQSRYRLVDLYVQAGDFKKAAAQARRIEKMAPEDPKALGAVSSAYLSMELPDKALVRQEKIVELAPDDISARVILGDIYRRLGRYPDAIRVYHSAYEETPTDITLLRALGEAYQSNADPNQALLYFKRAAEQEKKPGMKTGLLFLTVGHECYFLTRFFRMGFNPAALRSLFARSVFSQVKSG